MTESEERDGWPGARLNLSRFSWNDIAVFLALARHRSLTGAARELAVNHSTIGRRMRVLEIALDCKLFERTRSGFLLTDAGHRLLKEAEGAEAFIANIASAFGSEASRVSGTVRVATMEALGSLFLAPRFIELYERHPSVRVELVTASHWINLSKREADVLVSFPKPGGHRIASRKIGEFALFLYASQDYLSRRGTPESVKDLDRHVFVDYIDELVEISAVRWLSDVLRERECIFRSTSLVAQYHAALSGTGLAMLPTFVAGNDPRLRRVLPAQIKVKRDFWLSVHQDLEHIARVRQVMNFLQRIIADNAPFLDGH
jgi:DNA-binding transcriptional LysR family regulator